MVSEIRDPEVKRLVLERLEQFGVTPENKKAIPKDTWNEPLYMTAKPGRQSKDPAIIKKVRLIRRDETIQPIRDGNTWVKPGNTHHIALFEYTDKKGKTKRDMVSVSMLEAVQRIKNHEPVIQRIHPTIKDAIFLFSLCKGDTVFANFKDEELYLVYKTSASTQGQIYFASHLDARQSSKAKKYVANANTLDAKKIQVTPLGQVRWAND